MWPGVEEYGSGTIPDYYRFSIFYFRIIDPVVHSGCRIRAVPTRIAVARFSGV